LEPRPFRDQEPIRGTLASDDDEKVGGPLEPEKLAKAIDRDSPVFIVQIASLFPLSRSRFIGGVLNQVEDMIQWDGITLIPESDEGIPIRPPFQLLLDQYRLGRAFIGGLTDRILKFLFHRVDLYLSNILHQFKDLWCGIDTETATSAEIGIDYNLHVTSFPSTPS